MDLSESIEILILPEVDLQKYHDEDKPLPYEATPFMLKQELEKRLPNAVVKIAQNFEEAKNHISTAQIILADRLPKAIRADLSRWLCIPGPGK